jgi:hypothetical protein
MKIAFFVWGTLGFLFNLLGAVLIAKAGVDTPTQVLNYGTVVCLYWIGGMLFFGIGHLILRQK